MAKNLKLKIKNTQLAKAVNLGKSKADEKEKKEAPPKAASTEPTPPPASSLPTEKGEQGEKRRVRAKKRSDFAPPTPEEIEAAEKIQAQEEESPEVAEIVEVKPEPEVQEEPPQVEAEVVEEAPVPLSEAAPQEEEITPVAKLTEDDSPPQEESIVETILDEPLVAEKSSTAPVKKKEESSDNGEVTPKKRKIDLSALPPKDRGGYRPKQFKDVKPKRSGGRFDTRDRQGLRSGDEEGWRRARKRRGGAPVKEDTTIRPSELTIRLPISIKDLAASMKLKASQLLQKLLLQGVAMTLNDVLDDETTVQLLGEEFNCAIAIDTSEEERLRITDKTVREEIEETSADLLVTRPPVIAFMGHVDHGKTSLIDSIRNSNRVAGEAGAITQHIGAFQVVTDVGKLTILDTPGHEAFTSMRARGAEVTDIVILVVAGDEGVMPQTIEAIQHAKAAGVSIVVAVNKCDKPNFNIENVYRQLSEQELLPEAWGGSTIAIPCSANSGEGVAQLLEMTALQAEVLELGANPNERARGRVVESEMHKGLGVVATVLIQNGTLRQGDAVVFDREYGRIKTMRDEHGHDLAEAGPSAAVEITGLSGIPEAGDEFIVVADEREAKSICEGRRADVELGSTLKKRPMSMEGLLAEAADREKKVLKVILRADVQGSLEALRHSLQKIESDKADLEIIFSGVGAISESDVELAIASRAVILGFHTQVESHAEQLIRQSKVAVRQHDIIYHAIDDVKELMAGQLDKVAEEVAQGQVEVRAVFKAGHRVIAGCYVNEGAVGRNHRIRVLRDGKKVWEGTIASLRRDKDDVREVKKGLECGILLDGFNEVMVGDRLEAFEITYVTQEL